MALGFPSIVLQPADFVRLIGTGAGGAAVLVPARRVNGVQRAGGSGAGSGRQDVYSRAATPIRPDGRFQRPARFVQVPEPGRARS